MYQCLEDGSTTGRQWNEAGRTSGSLLQWYMGNSLRWLFRWQGRYSCLQESVWLRVSSCFAVLLQAFLKARIVIIWDTVSATYANACCNAVVKSKSVISLAWLQRVKLCFLTSELHRDLSVAFLWAICIGRLWYLSCAFYDGMSILFRCKDVLKTNRPSACLSCYAFVKLCQRCCRLANKCF